ncbi:MAG: carbohydrate kinase family protein [Puniceicoccaceae bacterium]
MIADNQNGSLRAACFSVAVLDYFCLQDEFFAGGNSLNQAVQYSRSGLDCAFVGAVGDDLPGQRLSALLETHGIDTSHMYRMDGETARNWIRVDEAGERFGVMGTWRGGVFEDFRLNEADWDFLADFDIWSTLAGCPNFVETLRRKTSKQCLAVDFLHLEDFAQLENSLGEIDIAFVGGESRQVQPLQELAAKMDALIVLTLGAKGSMAFHGSRVFAQDALPVDIVIDTTGCGDAFQAAFCHSYVKSRDIQLSLQAGSHAARARTMRFGGVSWSA